MTDDVRNDYQLIEQANEILRQAGCGIFGEPRTDRNYKQARFEYRMRTGAFSRCDNKRGGN